MKQVSQEKLQKEMESVCKPLALSSGLSELPYSDLSDRDFENLVYCLVCAEIDLKEYKGFDDVSLMQGVGERGRDCVLYTGGRVSGLIQCKKQNSRINRPDVIREASKFVLFSILDKELMPDVNAFEYHLYSSGGFSEPAVKLLHGFSTEIEEEINDKKIESYLSEIISSYESFKCFEDDIPVRQVCEALKRIKFKSFDSASLNSRLHQKNSVLSSFFQVRNVVECQPLLQHLDQKWKEAGLNLLTDGALKSLHERLGSVSNELRVGLGSLDLYGYSLGFMRFIGTDAFNEMLKASSELSVFLDKKLSEYLAERSSDLLYKEITVPFVHAGIVVPFTVNVINQYIVRRVLSKVQVDSLTPGLLDMMYPDAKLSRDEFLNNILSYNVESQKMVAAGDYSRLPDPDPDREKRLRLFEGLRAGLDVGELEARFWIDAAKILRITDSIVDEVSSEFSPVRTLVVKDYSFMKDPQEARSVMELVRGLSG